MATSKEITDREDSQGDCTADVVSKNAGHRCQPRPPTLPLLREERERRGEYTRISKSQQRGGDTCTQSIAKVLSCLNPSQLTCPSEWGPYSPANI